MQNRTFNREREMPLNWRRGLFRLWILVSGAWIVGWLIYYAIDLIANQWTSREFLIVPIVLFGPPLALLLFAIATRWAFQGFENP
ncbi:MAG TPA: hypothetical protein VE986_06240 [Hyphomicrobiales bacterium]|nr:hypothetical protein [Hyphomicrobiales bacterium]